MSRKYTQQHVIQAIQETHGLVYQAARHLGCAPQTVYTYMKRYPKVREALETAKGEFVDLGEQKLYDAVTRGDQWAVSLLLKTLGKDRGYTERQEITGADGEPIRHRIGPDLEHLSDEQQRAYLRAIGQAATQVAAERGD